MNRSKGNEATRWFSKPKMLASSSGGAAVRTEGSNERLLWQMMPQKRLSITVPYAPQSDRVSLLLAIALSFTKLGRKVLQKAPRYYPTE